MLHIPTTQFALEATRTIQMGEERGDEILLLNLRHIIVTVFHKDKKEEKRK